MCVDNHFKKREVDFKENLEQMEEKYKEFSFTKSFDLHLNSKYHTYIQNLFLLQEQQEYFHNEEV